MCLLNRTFKLYTFKTDQLFLQQVESAENGSEDEATRAEEKMFEDILRDLCIL